MRLESAAQMGESGQFQNISTWHKCCCHFIENSN